MTEKKKKKTKEQRRSVMYSNTSQRYKRSTHNVGMEDAPIVPPTMISIRRSTITSMSSTMSTSTSSTWTTETPEFEMEGRMGITEAAAQLAKAKAVKTAGSSMRETRPWRVRDMVVEGRSKEETKEGEARGGCAAIA